MKISQNLYVDEGVGYHRWKIWKLRRNKKVEDIYCILYKDNGFLEIISSKRIKGDHKESVLIGIAMTKQDALGLVARIFHEIYRPNPNMQEMKDYFTVNSS